MFYYNLLKYSCEELKVDEEVRRLLLKILEKLEDLTEEMKSLKRLMMRNEFAEKINLSDFSQSLSEIINKELSRALKSVGRVLDNILEKRIVLYPFSKRGPVLIKLSAMFRDFINKGETLEEIEEIIKEAEERVEKAVENESFIEGVLSDLIRSLEPSEVADTLSVLSNPERIRILMLLLEKDRYFSEFEDLMRIGPSSLRHHLSKLVSAGLVKQERSRGKYAITPRGIVALVLLAYLYRKVLKGGGGEENE